MKRLLTFFAIVGLMAGAFEWGTAAQHVAQAYTQSDLIDNSVFDNVGTMTEAQVQAFLNGTESPSRLGAGGSTCLKNYSDTDFNWNGSSWVYSGTIPAYKIIYKAAQQWGLNPEVIISKLQQEESLVSGTDCNNVRLTSAMGYGCPDGNARFDYPAIGVTQTCVTQQRWAGFSRQVLWGSWQLMFDRQRATGNTAWDDDGDINYGGFMTAGSFARCATCSAFSYDGNATIDGTVVYMQNGATAAIYTYTPHLNSSFPGVFSSWFGTTTGGPQPIYRLFYSPTQDHLLTASPAERNFAANQIGFKYENVAFFVNLSPDTGLQPVYRLYSRPLLDHVYTADTNEISFDTSRLGYVNEGVAFYAPAGWAAGQVPTYRIYDPRSHHHLFTDNSVERSVLTSQYGYMDEGTPFYVSPNGN